MMLRNSGLVAFLFKGLSFHKPVFFCGRLDSFPWRFPSERLRDFEIASKMFPQRDLVSSWMNEPKDLISEGPRLHSD